MHDGLSMTNRLLALCLAVVLVVSCDGVNAATDANELRVDGARLNASMEMMKSFGVSPSGGSERVAFSDANLDAYRYVAGLMSEAGLITRIDAAGNLIGRREGKRPGLAPLVSGSHIDTVPEGGHYDGIVGVMAAIEVARTLADAGYVTDHPLEMIVWSNEEGGKTGSRSFNGSVTQEDTQRPSLGDKSIGEGMRFLGGDPARLSANIRDRGAIAGYVELHIEQGAIMDKDNVSIGVVDGIVGIKRWNITVSGAANHAGTTPMDQRRDALFPAAQLITEVRSIITSEPGRQVGTVGRIQAYPGAPNVIPGRVTMSLEIRDLDMEKIDSLFSRIEAAARNLGNRTRTTFTFDEFYVSPAAITDERISQLIEDSARRLGLSTMHLPSGAGHDAQSIAPIAPIGMIFVPSRDGVSHAPTEFTRAQHVTDGANVLLQTIIGLDRALH